MSKRISILMVLAALTISAQAKVRLPHIIGDNMILQQQTDARLWGWAQPGKTVIRLSVPRSAKTASGW